MIAQMVFILNDLRSIKMVDPNELKNFILDTLQREALEQKQADLTHKMNMRGLNRTAGYELQDARAHAQAQRLKEFVNQAKSEWNRGYNNDWISSTYSMIALCEEIGLLYKEWNPIGHILREFDPVFDELINKRIDAYLYNNPPQKVLPKLRYHAEMDTNGKLDFSSLKDMKRSDGGQMFAPIESVPQSEEEQAMNAREQMKLNALKTKLEKNLKDGVTAWLDGIGYEPERKANNAGVLVETGVFLDKRDHMTKLTAEKFKEYRDNQEHPERSFNAFLTGTFEGIDFEQEASFSMGR